MGGRAEKGPSLPFSFPLEKMSDLRTKRQKKVKEGGICENRTPRALPIWLVREKGRRERLRPKGKSERRNRKKDQSSRPEIDLTP